MKFRAFPIFLCLALMASLVGCGNETVSAPTTETSVSAAPEAFGDMSLAETPIQEAQTTLLPADAPAEDESIIEAPQSAVEAPAAIQDYTAEAVTAAIICDAVDMLEYNPTDDQYLWRCVGYLIGQIGAEGDLITMEGDFGKITAQDAAIFAYAVSSDFDGNIPSVTEEDPLISKSEDGGYFINMLSQGELELNMTENRFSSDDDTFTEEAELLQNGESLGRYTVTLKKYAGDDNGSNYFAYSILGLVPLNEP